MTRIGGGISAILGPSSCGCAVRHTPNIRTGSAAQAQINPAFAGSFGLECPRAGFVVSTQNRGHVCIQNDISHGSTACKRRDRLSRQRNSERVTGLKVLSNRANGGDKRRETATARRYIHVLRNRDSVFTNCYGMLADSVKKKLSSKLRRADACLSSGEGNTVQRLWIVKLWKLTKTEQTT